MESSINIGAGGLRVGDRITYPRPASSPPLSTVTSREVLTPPEPVGAVYVAVRTRDGHGTEVTETFRRDAGMVVSR